MYRVGRGRYENWKMTSDVTSMRKEIKELRKNWEMSISV